MLKLLYEGILIRENGIIKKASSSSTLIITNNHNIIVDTSTRDMKDMIIKGLSELNLTLDDIDVVINTHLHYDHIENNSLFKNATFYASPKEFGFDDTYYDLVLALEKEPQKGNNFRPVLEIKQLAKKISFLKQ